MDWTSVYAETGEEEFVVSRRKKAPRLSRLISAIYHHSSNSKEPSDSSPQIQRPQRHHYANDDNNEEQDDDDFSSHRLFQLSSFHHESYPGFETTTSDEQEYSSSYTLRALYCLTINYILGVGCLGVPYAFARAGFILFGGIIILVTLFSFWTVMWVAEAGARAELEVKDGFQEFKPNNNDEKKKKTTTMTIIKQGIHGQDDHQITTSEETRLLIEKEQVKSNEGNVNDNFDPDHYEVIDLVSYFLGPIHSILYQVCLLALMYVGLLAYSQVFCGALAALLPTNNDNKDHDNFWISILPQLLFGIVVIPLSCSELDEQIGVQFLMAIIRFAAIFVMVGGSIIALFIDEDNADGTRIHPPYFAPADEKDNLMNYTICFSGFGVAFSTALFSQLFQHSVPGLTRPLKTQKEKVEKVPFVFGASLFTTCTMYIILGASAASYFGSKTESSININFVDFSYGFKPENLSTLELTICKVASNIVVMFPALDTLSVFPLIANTLGNNLLAVSSPWFLKSVKRLIFQWKDSCLIQYIMFTSNKTKKFDSDDVTESKKALLQLSTQVATVVWRLVASIPPLILSFWVNDLSFSILLAGAAGVYIAFVAPSLLQICSVRREERRINEITGAERISVYTGWYSGRGLTYPVLLFATFALGMVLKEIRDVLVDREL